MPGGLGVSPIGEQLHEKCGEPPRLWRHFGCETWDCGDADSYVQNCSGSRSGTKCEPPKWNCSLSTSIVAKGSYGCIRGQWLDILPLCLGSTAPAVLGAKWFTNQTVRAVIFRVNISWDAGDVAYQPTICARTRTGSLSFKSCEQVGFGRFLEKNAWPLMARPLQDAMCPETDSVTDQNTCNGELSKHLDRMRIAGFHGGGSVNGSGTLTFYMNAVPTLATGAESLLKDILAFKTSVGSSGARITADDLWDSVATPPESNWFRRGLDELKRNPMAFGIRDTGIKDKFRFPSWNISVSEPYIINRHVVPDWRLNAPPAHEPDKYKHLIDSLGDFEGAVIPVFCVVLGTAWMVLLLVRFCCWSCLYGAQRRWRLGHTVRAVTLLALLTDTSHILMVLCVVGMTVWLSTQGIFDATDATVSRSPQYGALLLPILAIMILPSVTLSLKLLRPSHSGKDIKDQKVPMPGHVWCWRVRPVTWFRIFNAAVSWHAVGMFALLAVSVMRLSSGSLGEDSGRSAQQKAVDTCNTDLLKSCHRDDKWQLRDFSRWIRTFCARDCASIPVPMQPAVTLEVLLYEMQIVMSAWSIVVRLLQLAMIWALQAWMRTAKYDANSVSSETPDWAANLGNGPATPPAAVGAPTFEDVPEKPQSDIAPVLVVVSDDEPVNLGSFNPTFGDDPDAQSARSKKSGRSNRSKADSDINPTSGSLDLEKMASSMEDGEVAPHVAAEPEEPEPKSASSKLATMFSRKKETSSESSNKKNRTPKEELEDLHREMAALQQELGHTGPREAGGSADPEDRGRLAVPDGLTNKIVGDEKQVMDFAQMIAREVSRDSQSSRPSEDSRPNSARSHSSSKSGASAEGGAGKKRFVADW